MSGSAAIHRETDRDFGRGLARAAGGAIIFSLPLIMTMEMWQLGFYMERARLVLFLLLMPPLLTVLSRYVGFEPTTGLLDDAVDAFVALAVGFLTSTAILTTLGILEPGIGLDAAIGMVALQAVPASIGAMLARAQLGAADRSSEPSGRAEPHYAGELFMMAVGALFLAFNVAPTEEMVLIGYRMTAWHALALAALSLLLMHAFVYAVEFRGTHELSPETPWWSAFLRFTMAGYAIALVVSAYVLWTFGRWDGLAPEQMLMTMLVLGFPAALGAAAARLIL